MQNDPRKGPGPIDIYKSKRENEFDSFSKGCMFTLLVFFIIACILICLGFCTAHIIHVHM